MTSVYQGEQHMLPFNLEEGSVAGRVGDDRIGSSSDDRLGQVYKKFMIITTMSIAAIMCITHAPDIIPISGYDVYSVLDSVTDLRVPKSTDEFITGDIRQSNSIENGKIENLIDLPVDCDGAAMVAFEFIGPKRTAEDDLRYDFTCDASESPVFEKIRLKTDSVPNLKGKSVLNMQHFDVDCAAEGVNFLLSSFSMKTDPDSEDPENPDIFIEYSCVNYEEAMVTCSHFYTDLVKPSFDLQHESAGDISTLEEAEAAKCYDGGALQQFQYEVVDDQIRYQYQCCMKSPLPTTSPTQRPVMEPTMLPTREPHHGKTKPPVANPSQEPTLEPSREPTREPHIKKTFEPTQEPVAHPTQHPSFEPTHEPTVEPTLHRTPGPTLEPSRMPTPNPTHHPHSRKSGAPHAHPTQEPTFEPSMNPTKEPIANPTMHPTTDPEGEEIDIAQYNLPKYCPFTYLAGTTELDIPGGCAFFTEDDLRYMRDDETSASLIICTGSELGNLDLELHEFKRFGLFRNHESLVSEVVPGKDTIVPLYIGHFEDLYDVYTQDHHPRLTDGEKNDQVLSAVLRTSVRAKNVRIPKVCDVEDAKHSVEVAEDHVGEDINEVDEKETTAHDDSQDEHGARMMELENKKEYMARTEKIQKSTHEKYSNNKMHIKKSTKTDHARREREVDQYLKEISGSTSPIVESEEELEAARKGKITYDAGANIKDEIERKEKEAAFKVLSSSAVDSIFD